MACPSCIRRLRGIEKRSLVYQAKRKPPPTPGAKKQRRYKNRRLKLGLDALWMVGYDGPPPSPESAWPATIAYYRLHGFPRLRSACYPDDMKILRPANQYGGAPGVGLISLLQFSEFLKEIVTGPLRIQCDLATVRIVPRTQGDLKQDTSDDLTYQQAMKHFEVSALEEIDSPPIEIEATFADLAGASGDPADPANPGPKHPAVLHAAQHVNVADFAAGYHGTIANPDATLDAKVGFLATWFHLTASAAQALLAQNGVS